MIIYDSLKNKYPFGAVGTNSPILLNIKISNDIDVTDFCMVLRERHEEIGKKIYFAKDKVDKIYTDYILSFSVEKEGIYYYRFEIATPNGIKFVGRDNLNRAVIEDFLPEWQLTVYQTGYEVPNDRRGNITYQIFVDRFNKGKDIPFNKFGVKKEWYEPLTIVDADGVYRANDFYGGNLSGITAKLDYIKSLGVKNIYLSPIFEASSNHRYDTGDYLKIDSLLGDEADFKQLVDKAKSLGIGVMLDGVFNHTGADSVYFNKFNHYDSVGAYQSTKSPYYDWYSFEEFPDKYACWWGVTVVPTVTNKQSASFQHLIFDEVINKWTKFGISGWRLDVVDELPKFFVDKIRATVKKIDKNAVIIGEVWEDASTKVSYSTMRPYLLGNQLDGVMNYPFKEAIIDYLLTGKNIAFWEKVSAIVNNYPKQALEVSLTLLDSHDTFRILNVLSKVDTSNMTKADRQNYRFSEKEYNNAKRLLRLAVVLQYTLIGSPTVFYGDEQGITGWDDPLSRPTFREKDTEIYEFYKKIGQIHNDNINEFLGGFVPYYDSSMVMYDRTSEKSVIKVVVNNSTEEQNFIADCDYVDLFTNEIFHNGDKISVNKTDFRLLKNYK